MADWKDYLKNLYYDPSKQGSLSGPDKLHKLVKELGERRIGIRRIKKGLSEQEDYTTLRQFRRKFKRNRVIVAGIDDLWDADLIDFQSLAKYNDGAGYILVVIDVFSRYLFTRPLRTKSGTEVARAWRSIFDEGRIPNSIRTDGGREFSNPDVKRVYKHYDVHHYTAHSESHANYAERVIKTIKSRMWRLMRHNKTLHYLDDVKSITNIYNSTQHPSLGRAPKDITKANEDESRYEQALLREKEANGERVKKPKSVLSKKKPKYRYGVGDHVRMAESRRPFATEYSEKWTGEIFKIKHRYMRENIPVYTVEDLAGEVIQGTFYQDELQKVVYDPNAEFRVEKVIKKRERKGHPPESKVKWYSWPSKFNS